MSALIAISTGSIIYSCEKPTIDQSDTPEVLIDPTPLEITASGFLFDAPVLHVIY